MGLLTSLHAPIYERRIEVLSDLICAELRPGDRVLDIGCGNGRLGKAILDHPNCPQGVLVEGCEKVARGDEAIPVFPFDGYRIDAADGHWDVAILADVVHHESEPMTLLREVARVTSRSLIIKDHTAAGFLGHQRICFMDWAANKPYGVPCLYRYFSAERWREIFAELGLKPSRELRSIDLYPAGWNLIFGRRLQYLAVASQPKSTEAQ